MGAGGGGLDILRGRPHLHALLLRKRGLGDQRQQSVVSSAGSFSHEWKYFLHLSLVTGQAGSPLARGLGLLTLGSADRKAGFLCGRGLISPWLLPLLLMPAGNQGSQTRTLIAKQGDLRTYLFYCLF